MIINVKRVTPNEESVYSRKGSAMFNFVVAKNVFLMTDSQQNVSTAITDVKSCVIGTRESKLALWQAHYTQKLLMNSTSTFNFTIKGMTTLGDNDQNTALSQFTKQGIFTKELDVALLQHRIDCAVHCVKDLPTELPQGLIIVSYLPRGKTNDCCIIDRIKHPNVFSFEHLPKVYSLPNV